MKNDPTPSQTESVGVFFCPRPLNLVDFTGYAVIYHHGAGNLTAKSDRIKEFAPSRIIFIALGHGDI